MIVKPTQGKYAVTTFSPGDLIRIKTDPGRIGEFTGKIRGRGDEQRLQIRFPDRSQWVPEAHLEMVSTDGEEPIDLLRKGRLARAIDLRRTLTHARLTGRLANIIYSLDTTGADFYAYQFKPLVKLLNSAISGILIADEVGLGKTIEAGLLWTELRSRYEYGRLVILCPAMLREKWRRELRNRFGVEAQIVDAAGLHEKLREARAEPDHARFAVIASLQGVRPRRGWDSEELGDPSTHGATALARFLRENAHDRSLIDVAVIDEAHYLRNRETMTAKAGGLVRDVANHTILLSATPIHLKNEDLFNLLNLVDPATFDQERAFGDILEANESLVRARDLVATGKARRSEVKALLEQAADHRLLRGSQQLPLLISELPQDAELRIPETASQLAGRLETINLLGHALTRTRKRDVQDWRVVREPVAEAVPLAPEEEEFYEAVTAVVREYAETSEGHEGFLAVMPQRQVSSSMPAAYRSWSRRLRWDDDAAYEEFGVEADPGALGPLVREIAERIDGLGSYELLKENDSKYARLRAKLQSLYTEEPSEKVVLFSTFRPTLAYLEERLREDGINTMVLHGGTDDKDATVDAFRETSDGAVLLSSEVASEGIDLQFAWILVNYDLPWNPMKVEQRIGRLDRLGQQSPKIAIWNLFYDGTIDGRIYRRLFERLGIFERSLGAIEPVLGDVVQKLTLDLLRKDLTPEKEEEQIEQTAMALENRRSQEEDLEGEAAHLVAYGDYIVNQIHTAREMSRKIEAEDLCRYATEFLHGHYPGCELRQVSTDLDFEITLSAEAKHDFERFLEKRKLRGATKLSRVDTRNVTCRFENSVASASAAHTEIINQLHPLVRFVSAKIAEDERQSLRPAVAILLDHVAVAEPIAPGTYVFTVERWAMGGIRQVEHLSYCVASLDEPDVLFTGDDAERLVQTAGALGQDWLSAATAVRFEDVSAVAEDRCLEASHQAYSKRVAELRAQNEDRVQIQERTLDQRLHDERSGIEEVIRRHREQKRDHLIPMNEGRIRALEERIERKRREIAAHRDFEHHSEDICVGVLHVARAS